jgi:hypothetical protein
MLNGATIDIYGVLNGLFKLGSFFLIIHTAAETIIKANNVPIFTNFAISSIGNKADINATTAPVNIVDLYGVLI